MGIKKKRLYPYILASLFVLQLIFTLFYESFTGSRNFYPFYTGKIFHPRPDKYMLRHRGYVLKIDDKEFDEPLDFLDYEIWQQYFPNMDRYTMSRKIHRLGEYIQRENETLASQERKEIDEIILKKHAFVRWDLFRLKVDPIEFVQHKKVEEKTFLKSYESHR